MWESFHISQHSISIAGGTICTWRMAWGGGRSHTYTHIAHNKENFSWICWKQLLQQCSHVHQLTVYLAQIEFVHSVNCTSVFYVIMFQATCLHPFQENSHDLFSSLGTRGISCTRWMEILLLQFRGQNYRQWKPCKNHATSGTKGI